MMPDSSQPKPMQQPADPRWFIWTIVFLVVAGISLASFIMFSDSGQYDPSPVVTRPLKPKVPTQASTTPQNPTQQK